MGWDQIVISLEQIISPDVWSAIRQGMPLGSPIYLVGGTVRDALLGIEPHDLDFCMGEKVKVTSRKIADKLGGAFYALDEERNNYRVIHTNVRGRRISIDFAGLRGPDIISDLRARDFTINAMGLDVSAPETIIDPTGGAQDLLNHILRMCSPDAFQEDPIRVLRGLRLAVVFHLHIEEKTRRAMAAGMPALTGTSPERQRDELFRILESPQPSAALRTLDILGGLPYLLPEISSIKGALQTQPHYQDVWNHSLSVLDMLRRLLNVLAAENAETKDSNLHTALASHRLGRFRPQLVDHFSQEVSSGRSLIGLVNLAALYHDVGKPASASMDADGRIHNFGHEKISADLASLRAQALQLSRLECDRLRLIVQNHMRIHSLVATGKPPTRRAIYRFFKETGDAGIDVCLLTLADTLGTYGPALPQDTWLAYLDASRVMMEAWWERNGEQVDPPVLLNGNDLMDLFQLQPGPQLGQILAVLREQQAMGLIQTRAEAIEFVRSMIRDVMV